jgi:hypothetical protein
MSCNKTIIECVKENNLEMFKCAMESKHLTKPSDYEIATHAIQHNGEAWYPYILRAVSESSNPRRIEVEVKEERVTNLQKALAVIEECDLPDGKYLELCNLLMDVHRRGVTA